MSLRLSEIQNIHEFNVHFSENVMFDVNVLFLRQTCVANILLYLPHYIVLHLNSYMYENLMKKHEKRSQNVISGAILMFFIHSN